VAAITPVVRLCARGAFEPSDDPQGIMIDLLPADARMLAVLLLAAAEEVEATSRD
jgi:hypothetical protein